MKVVIELNGFSDNPTSDVVHEEDRRGRLVIDRLYTSFVSGMTGDTTEYRGITGTLTTK